MLLLLAKFFQFKFLFFVCSDLLWRAIMAAITSGILCLSLGPSVIRMLSKLKFGQIIRHDGPSTHLVKTGTPTMGGVLILLSILFSTILWAKINNRFIWIVLFVMVSFGLIGFLDDYKKIIHRNTIGLSPRKKFFLQAIIGLNTVFSLPFFLDCSALHRDWYMVVKWLFDVSTAHLPITTLLVLPFFGVVHYPFGAIGFFFSSFLVLVGMSNAVNLTDGLDGLVAMLVVMISGALGIFAYFIGHSSIYTLYPCIVEVEELMVFCWAMSGACIAFLWYNTYPAQIFMGDVGALSLGGALGIVAIIVKQEIIFLVMCSVFLAETCSVIVQVLFFKWSKFYYGHGKRLLKMAPLHHHFELNGWHEMQIVGRFWIITVFLVLFGLLTLQRY